MWIIGEDLSLAWRISWIDTRFPRLTISWIAMEIVRLFTCFFLVNSHVSLVGVELLVLGALVGQMLWSFVTTRVELLVT